LSWNISAATTISIDNGVGDVSSLTSKSVAPAQTTTYKITAANSGGSTTAMVTVLVTPSQTPDTQPPTAPVLTSASAKSPTQVDLTWTASTDNVGVTGYQIQRNGSPLQSVGASVLAYSDSGAAANTTSTYSVRAFDAAGNYSGTSNGVPVTTPASPVAASCPAPATEAFTGCYYNNTDLAGTPALVRTDSRINFDWWYTSPASSVSKVNFSVRWQGNFFFTQGTYTFLAMASDGMRIWIDGNLILDRWRDQPVYNYTLRPTLTQGNHLVTVEYYERTGTGTAWLSWQKN
jgi:hypothetical protein